MDHLISGMGHLASALDYVIVSAVLQYLLLLSLLFSHWRLKVRLDKLERRDQQNSPMSVEQYRAMRKDRSGRL